LVTVAVFGAVVCPGWTRWNFSRLGWISIPVAVPVIGTVCGLSGASSTMVKVAVYLPEKVGANPIMTWQENDGLIPPAEPMLHSE
jgi:hypothetical protein